MPATRQTAAHGWGRPACKGLNAGSTQERPAPEANLGRAREWSKVMRNQHPAQGQGKCPQQGTGKRSCAKDGGELPALLLRSPACGAYRRAPYSQACIQERQVRHSQAMARLPDMPGASRPAGHAKAHCPHPVHVRSLTILNGTRRAKSARSAPAGHRYLHQKRGRTHSRTARTSQKTSTKEAVLKEPCSICR